MIKQIVEWILGAKLVCDCGNTYRVRVKLGDITTCNWCGTVHIRVKFTHMEV